jgi:LPS-assembly protein
MIPWERFTGPQQAPCYPGNQVREVLTWELAQKYFIDPTFGGALADAQRNVFTTTADFTGIAFLTQPRHLSPLISRLRIQTSSRTNAEWDADYDFRTGRLNASTALLNYRFGQFTVGGGDAFLRINGENMPSEPLATQDFHQFRVLFGYGFPNKRGFSGASSFGFDSNRGFLQYGTVQTTYNWDCCGFSVEYRRFALGSVRNENQFRFAFSLANVGAFGNLRRQERLF